MESVAGGPVSVQLEVLWDAVLNPLGEVNQFTKSGEYSTRYDRLTTLGQVIVTVPVCGFL